MTTLRIPALAALLGLAALPALADSYAFDLPRLDFPTGADVTRGASAPVVLPAPTGN